MAHMLIKFNKSSKKFQVQSFVAEHNDPLHILSCSHMMPSQCKMSGAQMYQIDLADDDAGIRLKDSHEIMSKHVGGKANIGFTKQDHKNIF